MLNKFTVGQIHIVGKPTSQNVFNQFDDFGLLLGLPRFTGEGIESYRSRLVDTYVSRANSTYTGLINGITRELGLDLFRPMRIYPIKNNNIFLAEDPVIIFRGPYIELWRDKKNNIIEMEIDRFNQDGDAYLIKDLFTTINNTSAYFRCGDLTNSYSRSMCLLNQSNTRSVFNEIISPTDRFTLLFPGNNGGFITDFLFSDNTVFQNRVDIIDDVVNDGDFFIDVYTGNVATALIPSIGTTVKYTWIDYSFYPVASPVIIHDVESMDFKRKLFQQVLADDGKYYNGIPTEYGAEIINHLISVFDLYYQN